MRAVSRARRTHLRRISAWWREPVDYLGYVQYFADRGLDRAIRGVIGAVAGCMSVFAMIGLLPAATASLASVAAIVVFAGISAFWVPMWWARPWPSYLQSRLFIASMDIGIVVIALVGSDWFVGLYAFHCFALVSVYLVFFDGSKTLAAHNAVVLTTVVIFILMERAEGHIDDGTFAGVVFGAIVPLAIATVGLQLGIQTLRNDANKSATDPLTGLLNRRGLYLHFRGPLLSEETARDSVTVIVVDLDRFKGINDAYGHDVGDTVLIRIAQQIRATVSSSALVARLGGEEFVVVNASTPEQGQDTAEKIRLAIAKSEPDRYPAITASLGVHTVERATFTVPGADLRRLLDSAINRADQAMFLAKRRGGNSTASTDGRESANPRDESDR